MKGNIASTICFFLLLLIFWQQYAGAEAVDILNAPPAFFRQETQHNSPYVSSGSPGIEPSASGSYTTACPDLILRKLGIEPSAPAEHASEFLEDPIHRDWMNHADDVLPKINLKKTDLIDRTHTTLLFIKDKMNTALLNGKIDKQEYTTLLAELIKWFQKANRSFLNAEEYNTLFGISMPDDHPVSDNLPGGKPVFPVINPETPVEMIKKKFDDKTLTDITRFYRQQSRELSDIRAIYETDAFPGVEREQIRMDMLRIENELTANFRDYCRNRLSEEQFKLLFGNDEKLQ